MTDVNPRPTDEIRTQEQAINLVDEYCQKAVQSRVNCNVIIPGDQCATVKAQQEAYDNWLRWYGCAIGALVALHRARLIPENAYTQLQQKVYNTLAPQVVGDVRLPIQRGR